VGILAAGFGDGSAIDIDNKGSIEADNLGIAAFSFGYANSIAINNSGSITTTGAGGSFDYTSLPICGCYLYGVAFLGNGSVGIAAATLGLSNSITIVNSGKVEALGRFGIGIGAFTDGPNSPISIVNSGSVYGGFAAILATSASGTTIINTGNISAGSNFAIGVEAGSAAIYNAGHITGFVVLDADDIFVNQAGGVFETKLTSDFGPGSDLFRNEEGGTVLAATNPNVSETSSFVEVERFENKGLISMQDGTVGDSFQISNTIAATDLEFVGSGKSTLAIDAFLDGPGSVSDDFIIDGDVSGKTGIDVNNTNRGPGVFNKEGIPVIYVNGPNVSGDEFFLAKPIDTGFFDYDLFFRPTGSGVFELRSFLGAGAFVLPQLVTATQDIWHAGSSTWFDRSTDLRVLLNGGAAPVAYDPNAQYGSGAPAGGAITPAVWARGAGNWLDREDNESVTAYGRDYRYKLDRDLETIDFQMGLDLGKRGLFSDNDILVFGALGGFVHADLDYDQIGRSFDFQGGQVGGYATYLRGGLFVDTLLNVHLLELDPNHALGFPGSLDATNVGLRTDTGYRFGSFRGGAFLEPLATLSVNWADIDGFSLGGNKVSFDDEANVRGRLGLRVGTSFPVWTGTTMEPFVIGSVWGNLTDNNEATLVSTGTIFHLEDDLDDVWGEVSVGANFFNPNANTSVFAKLDVTFGDDVEGVGGKAGMRVSW
jgi:autotransporter family porin